MTAPFRLYGAALSPFSSKVRSYLAYKGVAFDWLERTQARAEEVAKHAKSPLAPILVDADDKVLQDSTIIIETMERENAEPSIVPDDAALAFVSVLLEDYADEWLNKAMFHYRWSYPEDQASAATRTLELLFEGGEAPEGLADSVRTRMTARLHHVGSSPDNAPVIEGSFAMVVRLLETLLGNRPYLFGGRPSLADFSLAGQFAQLLSDPTPGAMLRAQAPNLVRWVERMEKPKNEGPFVPLSAVRDEIVALLREEIAPVYLAWMAANALAVNNDASGVTVEISGQTFTQKPQRTAAKAMVALQRKRAAIEDEALAALLAETGCDAALVSVATLASPEIDADDADADAGDDEDEGGEE